MLTQVVISWRGAITCPHCGADFSLLRPAIVICWREHGGRRVDRGIANTISARENSGELPAPFSLQQILSHSFHPNTHSPTRPESGKSRDLGDMVPLGPENAPKSHVRQIQCDLESKRLDLRRCLCRLRTAISQMEAMKRKGAETNTKCLWGAAVRRNRGDV
jgi:hypothetical protein